MKYMVYSTRSRFRRERVCLLAGKLYLTRFLTNRCVPQIR
jgi:hypothetical protein